MVKSFCKKVGLSALVATGLLGSSYMDVRAEHSETDIRYVSHELYESSYHMQSLIQQGGDWQQFVAKEPTWHATFDERTGMPRRSFGSPIQVVSVSNNPEDVALQFLQQHVSQFTTDIDLRLSNVSETEKYFYVDFNQFHQGSQVLFARATVRLSKDLRVVMFGLDLHPNIGVSTKTSTDQTAAFAELEKAFENPVDQINVVNPIAVLPIPRNGKYEYKVVRAVEVTTQEPHWFGNYTAFIDANTHELLYRANNLHHAGHTFTATDEVTLENPHLGEEPANLPYIRLVLDNGQTYYADANGQFDIDETLPVSGTLHLDGHWSYIQNTTEEFRISERVTITSETETIGFSDAVGLEEKSAYYHANIVHDYMKQFLVDFAGLDEPLQTNVNLNIDNCNAFYDGNSINFFTQGGGCYSFARVRDVVYHEYGHGINGRFYAEKGSSFRNGAMNEGYADIWGMGITENPMLGLGSRISNPNSTVRRYNGTPKVYPDNLIGQVHNDGEIIAGAWWRTGQEIGDPQVMIRIFSESMYGLATGPNGSEGQVYRDILLDAILADDDDADLSNGTPHLTEIVESFAVHGIFLDQSGYTHEAVSEGVAKEPINLTIESELSELASLANINADAKVYYRPLGQNLWQEVPGEMQDETGEFSFAIPGQPAGTILEYIINVLNSEEDVIQVIPEGYGQGATPFRVLVGFVDVSVDNLNESQTDWKLFDAFDDAETGQWIIAEPIETSSGGVVVQPGTDHSPDNTNICAVTGNAEPGEQFGANDVDNGTTTLYSPEYAIGDLVRPVVTYWRWFSNSQGDNPGRDLWTVEATVDGVSWETVEITNAEELAWRQVIVDVHDLFPGAETIQLRFIASDDPDNGGSIVEAAVDDVTVKDAPEWVSSVELASEYGVSLYPSPASSAVTLQGIPASTSAISIHDVNGKSVLNLDSATPSANTIDVRSLPQGQYRVVLQLEDKQLQIPFVITR